MKKIFLLCVILTVLSSCSQLSLLASGSSIAISQNSFVKMYNAADFGVALTTKKGIKQHVYEKGKKAWTEVKEGKKYIYDKTWGLTDN